MPARARKTLLTSVLCASLLASACSSGLIKSLRDLARLRQQLIDKYHEQDLNVNIQNSRYLSIVFINSPLNQQAPAVRAKRAQETARFVVSHYPAIREIRNIWIHFAVYETRLIIFHYSRNVEAFAFDNTGAETYPGPNGKADDRTPVARFNAARNETDVSITRLQLEGDLNHGIAMVPHFTVAGNVQDSNSKLGVPSLAVPTFAGDALLLTPQDSGSEGNTAQFLEAQIPMPQFAKMGSSREVKIKLGSRAFELSPEDINALRAMSDYAPLPHSPTR